MEDYFPDVTDDREPVLPDIECDMPDAEGWCVEGVAHDAF